MPAVQSSENPVQYLCGMKKRLFIALMLATAFIAGCSNPTDQIHEGTSSEALGVDAIDGGKLPEFTFQEEEFDFGLIQEGEVVTHDFKFTNTGEVPLVISAANGSCGCTVPEYPRTPIAPGAEAVIHVSFDSNKRGESKRRR